MEKCEYCKMSNSDGSCRSVPYMIDDYCDKAIDKMMENYRYVDSILKRLERKSKHENHK